MYITLSTEFGLSALFTKTYAISDNQSIMDHCFNNGAKICFPWDMMLTFTRFK